MKRLHAQRGSSLAELMVGLALGLVVTAVALSALIHHLQESRRLLAETRLMQDLRTVSELITRDLRRSGYWRDAAAGLGGREGEKPSNPNTALQAGEGALGLAYSGTAGEALAYRLRAGSIDRRWADSPWQSLTDAGTMQVTSLRITPRVREVALDRFCVRPCDAGDANCPPRQMLREAVVHIEARAARDASMVRQLQTTTQVRNDALSGRCPL